MANETIQVVYEPLKTIPGLDKTFYHETLLYTDSSGQQFIATAGPTGKQPVEVSDLLSALGEAAVGNNTSWGTLTCTTGSAETFPEEWKNKLIDPSNPSVTLATGEDLSQQWNKITQAEQEITDQNFSYSPLNLNSNSAANTALTAAGITLPTDNILSSDWAPAAWNILPTSMTQAITSDTITQSLDLAGGLVYTITDYDTGGKISDIIQIDPSTQSVDIKAFSNGNFQSDQNTTTSPNGTVTDDISGQGADATLNNATINLANNASADLQGGGNTVNVSEGAKLVCTDQSDASSNSFNMSDNSSLTDYASSAGPGDIVFSDPGIPGIKFTLAGGSATTELSDATITIQNGASLTEKGDNNCIDNSGIVVVDGNNNQVTLHAGDIASIVGDGNTVTADGAQINISGNGNTINASDASLTLGDNTSATITGSNDVLTLGTNSTADTYDLSTGIYGYDQKNADGSSIDYKTTYDNNGGYDQTWTASDGTSGVNDKFDDGSTLSTTANPDGSSTTNTYEPTTGI